MRKNLPFSALLLPALLLLFITSCQKDIRSETTEGTLSATSRSASAAQAEKASALSPAGARMAQSDLLKAVRRVTSQYHSTNQAMKDGYVPDEFCVAVPGLGGMGYHWANPLLEDGTFDPLKPEVILYARGPGGKLRLIGVEYVVLKTSEEQQRPMFGDQPFDINGTPIKDPHWSLHVWVHEENPSGLFAPFNPKITCP